MPSFSSGVYEFGPCRLDAGQRVVTRDQQRVPLPPKTFDLLLLLISSPGRAFSKQELMTALWPDISVEDASLTFQISTLRKALGEEAAAWIETVPKHGYRFAGPVATSLAAQATAASPVETAAVGPQPSRTHKGRRLTTTFLVGLIVLTAGYLALVYPRRTPPREPSNAIATPLTAYPGSETGPSLSPDESQVAFSWNGPGEDNYDVYIKLVGAGEPVRLTSAPERDESPAWSPDGGRIAFVRRIHERAGDVFVIPALGGAERRVVSFVLDSSRRSTRVSWSPDGKWLAIGGSQSSVAESLGLRLVEVDGSGTRSLTTPPGPEWQVDYGPVFSPDGRSIAFIRGKATNNAIFIVPLSPAMASAAEPVQVVSDPRRVIASLAWMPDGRSLVYSWGGHVAPTRLERIAISSDYKPVGRPEVLPFGDRATHISIGRTGRIAYSALLRDANLWKLDVTRADSVPVDAGLSRSTLDETAPAYSPDGQQIVFTSTRSGAEELWISNVDGSNLRLMTSIGGPQCSNANWAPDGQSIVFTSTRAGGSDLYLLFPATGEVRRLTTDPAAELEAHWSRDGRSIYFGSNRSGRFEIWRMRADGSGATQVTTRGGQTGQESPDRRSLYYAQQGSPSTIWRAPLDGGDAVRLVDGVSHPTNFVVGDRGIYLVAFAESAAKTSIDFFEFSTGRRMNLATVAKPWWFGIALSPDQRWLLFSTVDRDGSDLMLVNPVR
jgi:Tol biopolymer transport system component/DNA-binding winged helix-turn-helix (wHTH) protein